MGINRKGLVLALLAVLALAVAAAEMDRTGFPRYKRARISAAAVRGGAPALMKLDQDFYELTESLLSDLRVFTLEHREVPFLVERAVELRPVRRSGPADVKVVSRTRHAQRDEETLILEIGGDYREIRELEVVTASHDFERLVRVYGGPDGEVWQLLGEQVVFDCAAREGLRKTTIAVRPSLHRFFRLVIRRVDEDRQSPLKQFWQDHPGSDPARLREIRAGALAVDEVRAVGLSRESTPESAPVSEAYPVSITRMEELPGETVIGFEAKRAPLTHLELMAETPFFYRRIALYGAGADGVMRLLAEGTAMKLAETDSAVLPFPEQRCHAYELRIFNGNLLPLQGPGLRLSGPVYQVVLPFPAAETLRLYFGAAAPLPDYDIEELLNRKRGKEVAYTLEPRQNNPDFRPPARLFDRREGLVLAAGGLMLAGLVLGWRLFRRS